MTELIRTIKKALVLGPHPDDVEFGCMGTLLKLIEKGVEVHYAVFSMCEKSVPKGLPPDVIKKELLQVVKELKLPKKNLHLFNYEVRRFPQFRQEILEDLVALNKKINPDLVFLPSSSDIHQDHQTIHMEGKRAFKFNMILGYELPWNNFNFQTDYYTLLDEEKVNEKVRIIGLYASQKSRSYNDEDFLKSLLRIRGTQVKAKYAEAFEVIRLIV